MADAEHELAWFARDLIPQLRRTGAAPGVAGVWPIAAPRIASLQGALAALVASAPDDRRRAAAASADDAVRAAQVALDAVTAESTVPWETALDNAQARLLDALVPPSAGAKDAKSDR
jgi:hypothetical protein